MTSRKNSDAESAKRIRSALSRKGWSAQRLSEETGISKSSISQYVNGYSAPSNINAGKIGQALDVSPAWLMGFGSEDEEIVNQTVHKIISASRETRNKGKVKVSCHQIGSTHASSHSAGRVLASYRKPEGHGVIHTSIHSDGSGTIDRVEDDRLKRLSAYADMYNRLTEQNKRVVDGLVENLLENQSNSEFEM